MAPAWQWAPVVAHRCGGRLAPENSIEGLYRAADAGIRAVEFDVMLASCGTPVIIHDETLARTTDGQGRVDQIPWSQLQSCRLRDADGRLTESRLPCLDDALAACANLELGANIEIKPSAGHARDTGRAVALMTRSVLERRELQVLLTSFDRIALDAAMAAAPLLSYGHLFEGDAQRALREADLSGCRHLVFSDQGVTRAAVEEAMTHGYGVGVYTVNEPGRARELVSWGVAGVISDEPGRLNEALGKPSLA